MSVFAKQKKTRRSARLRRHRSIRKKLAGTAERPPLGVYRSLRQIEGQVVDDDAGRTLVGLNSLHPEVRDFEAEGQHRKVEQAFVAGKLLAEKALQAGIETVVFDRGGYKYHGRVKAFADGAREGGLKF